MNEFCLITFHTLLSSTVLQTKQLVQIESKCGWMDGWSQIYNTSKSMRAVIVFAIHLDLLPSFIRTQSLHSAADFECRYFPSGKDGEIDRPTDRQADRQRAEGEMAQRPPTAHIQIYYLCSRSGHFTAVFTLDPAVSIRWQGPGLQM